MKLITCHCAKCVGKDFIKYGKTACGKQRYQCKNCKAITIMDYSYKAYKDDINNKIILLIKEGLGIRSTARVLEISPSTLLKRILKIAEDISQPIIPFYRTYEMDEMRFFIRKKSNPMWLVYAIDKNTKQVMSFYIGKRNNQTLNAVVKTLLNSKAEMIFTDKLKNYQYLIPQELHNTKRYGTNGIERKNLGLRTHLKRLGRKTICFSRSIIILSAILKIYFWS